VRFAEEADAVEALDRAIRKEPAAVVDAVGSFLLHAGDEDISTLTGVGLPLRPAVLSRARMERVARELFMLGEATRDIVVAAAQEGWLGELDTPERFAAADIIASLTGAHALATMRPDGYLFDDAFRMTELNVGNGLLISCAYASAVHRFFTRFSPVVRAAGLDPAGIARSFDGLVDVLRQAAGKEAPRVALLLPQPDCLHSDTWGEKVHKQLAWAPRLLREAGLDVVVVDEAGLVVDRDGMCRTAEDGLLVDVVTLATTGLGLFDDVDKLAHGANRILRGTHVGHAPLVLPLAHLALEKGVLPALCLHPALRDLQDVVVQPTERPTDERAPAYRLERERWVMKRSYEDKHTFVGVAEFGRKWNWYVEQMLARQREYIMQEYVSLPTSIMPVLVDNKHIEWVPVRVELSPFLFGGKLCGAMTRYAPDAEGLVMSPPPPGMGFGVALLV
jgi:hypothetical protein